MLRVSSATCMSASRERCSCAVFSAFSRSGHRDGVCSSPARTACAPVKRSSPPPPSSHAYTSSTLHARKKFSPSMSSGSSTCCHAPHWAPGSRVMHSYSES
eukprot:3047526-Rhodomonas_salina.1